jgi:nitrate reductase alpha subunit
MMKRNLKKGAKLVVIDPKRIPMADQADMYMRIRPGTDGALALAMMNVIIAEDLYDHDFIEKHTTGFDKLVPHVKPYTRYSQTGETLRQYQRGQYLSGHLHTGSDSQWHPEQPCLCCSPNHHGQHQRAGRLGDEPATEVRASGLQCGRYAFGR